MLTDEIRDKHLKKELTRIARHIPQNCSGKLIKAFETSTIAHIERRTKTPEEQEKYLRFYQKQIEDKTKPFNPRYLENLPKI